MSRLLGCLIFAACVHSATALASTDLPFAWPEPGTVAPLDPGTALAPAWTAWGGRLTIEFNPDIFAAYGLEVAASGRGTAKSATLRIPLRDGGGMSFRVGGAQFQGFADGSLGLDGALSFTHAGKTLELKGLRVIPRAGDGWKLDLVDAKGTVWFNNDQVHYQLSPGRTQIAMFNMELRAAPAFAKWLGEPLIESRSIGDMAVLSSVRIDGDLKAAAKSCSAPNWRLAAGGPWVADVALIDLSSVEYKRCSGCSGQFGANDGNIVFAPNAELKNSSTTNAAEVPWYAKFSDPRPPYNNDQHPYLIWNLYRIDQNGRLEQIARSGLKHAFLTTNQQCVDAICGSLDGSILGRGCQDVYSSGNNDRSSALSPRREVVPATGIWGRCGSFYDANCDQLNDQPGDDAYRDRMQVHESQLRSANNPGASYFVDAWYVVRDDSDIYNTMGYRQVVPVFNGTWLLSNPSETGFVRGPVINAWVDPANPGANARNVEINTPEGQVRVAVRATQRTSGLWHYDYAVMNFSYSRADVRRETDPRFPNAEVYRVNRNFGLSAFEVPVGTATPSNTSFSDGDLSASNQWTAAVQAGKLRWTGSESSALNWGTLYSFSLDSSAAPGPATVSLRVLDKGIPQALTATVIGPTGTVASVVHD
jgi:hypothetical protein